MQDMNESTLMTESTLKALRQDLISEMTCPITQEIMRLPVGDAKLHTESEENHHFDYRAIKQWIKKSRNSTCPIDRDAYQGSPSELIVNRNLYSRIQIYWKRILDNKNSSTEKKKTAKEALKEMEKAKKEYDEDKNAAKQNRDQPSSQPIRTQRQPLNIIPALGPPRDTSRSDAAATILKSTMNQNGFPIATDRQIMFFKNNNGYYISVDDISIARQIKQFLASQYGINASLYSNHVNDFYINYKLLFEFSSLSILNVKLNFNDNNFMVGRWSSRHYHSQLIEDYENQPTPPTSFSSTYSHNYANTAQQDDGYGRRIYNLRGYSNNPYSAYSAQFLNQGNHGGMEGSPSDHTVDTQYLPNRDTTHNEYNDDYDYPSGSSNDYSNYSYSFNDNEDSNDVAYGTTSAFTRYSYNSYDDTSNANTTASANYSPNNATHSELPPSSDYYGASNTTTHYDDEGNYYPSSHAYHYPIRDSQSDAYTFSPTVPLSRHHNRHHNEGTHWHQQQTSMAQQPEQQQNSAPYSYAHQQHSHPQTYQSTTPPRSHFNPSTQNTYSVSRAPYTDRRHASHTDALTESLEALHLTSNRRNQARPSHNNPNSEPAQQQSDYQHNQNPYYRRGHGRR